MEKKELLECIDFFKKLKVVENEVTTEEERNNYSKVVVVAYSYEGQSFTTNKLYYKNISHQKHIRNPQSIIDYFGGEVYWLDNNVNAWAKGKGEAELEKTVIDAMVVDDDADFKILLKKIANNSKTGYVQRMTAEGKSQQYHHNFENNNHWHDIILLIQEIIDKKGAPVDRRFFSRLVFKWDGDKNTERERSSLAKVVRFTSRAFIDNVYRKIQSVQKESTDMEIIDTLLHKKQIILQGPPGTGKTRAAKDIAEQMIFSSVTEDKKQQKALLENTDQFKLIQFHPAYSYEDFVRGIVAESNGVSIEYKIINKLLAAFAKTALENYENSRKDTTQLSEENWIQENFMAFAESISDEIEKNSGKLLLTGTTTYLKEVESDCFRYTGDNWNSGVGNRMYFKDIIEMFRQKITERQGIKKMTGVSGLAIQHASYFMRVLDMFYAFMKDKERPRINMDKVDEKKYVLIIDEINRANLPAVLGELIYALEYRGEKVESMYATTDEGNTIILPPNLYIMGTMNTSDRSIGHIDYAIRRRFAFIDVLPKVLEGDTFDLELFKKVSALFIQNFDEYARDNTVELKQSEYLSEEFRPEDVWLGHSYFIKGDGDFSLRKKYEIVPILKEYVKDGILKQSAVPIINAL